MNKKNVLAIVGSFKDSFGKYDLEIKIKDGETDYEKKLIGSILDSYGDLISLDIIARDNTVYDTVTKYYSLESKPNDVKYVDSVFKLRRIIEEKTENKKYDLILDFSVMPKFRIDGFKLDGSDNKPMGDTFTSDYSNTVMTLKNQIKLLDGIGYPVKKVRFNNNLRSYSSEYDVVITNNISSFDDVSAERYFLTKDEIFVDLSVSDLLEDILGLFDRKIKYLETKEKAPTVSFINGLDSKDTESRKSGSTTVIRSNFKERYISAVLDQNDSNDEYSKYVFCSENVSDNDVLLHEMHVKTGKNRIVSRNMEGSFLLGVPSKIVSKDEEILDFVSNEINAVQSLRSLWNLGSTKRIVSSKLYRFDNYECITDESLEAIYFNDEFTITVVGTEEAIGTMKIDVKCDENSVPCEVEFELNIEEKGHHVIEAILKTFSDITVVAKQEQLADFLIEKYGFERREDGSAARIMA